MRAKQLKKKRAATVKRNQSRKGGSFTNQGNHRLCWKSRRRRAADRPSASGGQSHPVPRGTLLCRREGSPETLGKGGGGPRRSPRLRRGSGRGSGGAGLRAHRTTTATPSSGASRRLRRCRRRRVRPCTSPSHSLPLSFESRPPSAFGGEEGGTSLVCNQLLA